MILLKFLLFFLSIIVCSISISGYGSLLSHRIKNNFFLDIFLGFIAITFIITFTHYFLKINLLISFFIFVIGIIFFFYKRIVKFEKLIIKKNISYIIIIFLLVPIYLSQKYHEDFGYYHLPYAISFIEEKIVFGFANINKTYVYNSIWLNLYSIFFVGKKNLNFLTLPSFILFLSFVLFSFRCTISKNQKLLSDYFLITTIFYFILKFTRISEFGVDLPATIFCILTIYYFIKFSEINSFDEKREYFFLIFIFSIFSILIKLSTIPIILLPVYIYTKYFQIIKWHILKLKFCFVYLLITLFLIQQFIYTGCFFFPTNFTCLSVSWLDRDNLNLSNQIALINKGYFLEAKDIFSPKEYLTNFTWLNFWIKRNFIEILEHFSTIILPITLFLFCLKKKDNNSIFLKDKLGLYIFLIFGLIFWFYFSPVYRFAIHLFLIIFFILLIKFYISKEFSKKTFIVFFMTFIFFSFSKNLLRLNQAESIFVGIQKIENKYILNEKSFSKSVKIYQPDTNNNSKNGWQGRLCWNTPFICSTNNLYVYKKNGYLIINKIHN